MLGCEQRFLVLFAFVLFDVRFLFGFERSGSGLERVLPTSFGLQDVGVLFGVLFGSEADPHCFVRCFVRHPPCFHMRIVAGFGADTVLFGVLFGILWFCSTFCSARVLFGNPAPVFCFRSAQV